MSPTRPAISHRCSIALILASTALLAVSSARAQEPAPRVELALVGEWPEALRVAVRADLAATLRDLGLELVHAEDGAERVVATVRVSAPSDAEPRCLIDIDDAITGKHLERTVMLARVPVDGWSVAIAAGADELLRASWAELALHDAPPPELEPPAAVEAIVEQHIVGPMVAERVAAALSPSFARPSLVLGVRGALEGFLGGQIHVGGDLLAQVWLVDRVGLELAIGGRGGLDVATARGRVRSWALGGEIGPSFLLVSAPSPIRLEAFVLARFAWITYEADANAGSIAASASGVAVIGRAGLRAGLAIDRSQLIAELAVGVPFVGYEALDERGAVTGATGLEIHAGIGWTWEVAP